jgi:hypothetical protein
MTETAEHPPLVERRLSPRRRALLGAQIVFRDGNCSMACHVVSISSSGATLEPSDIFLCPAKFELIARFETPRKCEVIWRKGNRVGVRFIEN